MKIFAIGRNYVDHINELNNEKPQAPVVFMKPDTALLKNNADFYHPDFSNDIHHEVELVLRVSKEGKHIEEKFAHKYFDAIGVGVDFTARDVQQKQKEKGLPWEIAKSFDNSAPISTEFILAENIKDLGNINFSLRVNGETRQHGNTSLMLFNFNFIIAYVSTFFTLKKGDLIFTGTPKGVAAVKPGDYLEAFIEDDKMLHFNIK